MKGGEEKERIPSQTGSLYRQRRGSFSGSTHGPSQPVLGSDLGVSSIDCGLVYGPMVGARPAVRPAMTLTYGVTLGKLLHLFVLRFPPLENGKNKRTSSQGSNIISSYNVGWVLSYICSLPDSFKDKCCYRSRNWNFSLGLAHGMQSGHAELGLEHKTSSSLVIAPLPSPADGQVRGLAQ